jgi:hypothetical protein
MTSFFDIKTLPVIVLLLTNICGGVWYASSLDSRVSRLEENNLQIVSSLEGKNEQANSDRELLVRIDERMRTMTGDMAEIKRKLGETQ